MKKFYQRNLKTQMGKGTKLTAARTHAFWIFDGKNVKIAEKFSGKMLNKNYDRLNEFQV